jgi:hypothetical protein
LGVSKGERMVSFWPLPQLCTVAGMKSPVTSEEKGDMSASLHGYIHFHLQESNIYNFDILSYFEYCDMTE